MAKAFSQITLDFGAPEEPAMPGDAMSPETNPASAPNPADDIYIEEDQLTEAIELAGDSVPGEPQHFAFEEDPLTEETELPGDSASGRPQHFALEEDTVTEGSYEETTDLARARESILQFETDQVSMPETPTGEPEMESNSTVNDKPAQPVPGKAYSGRGRRSLKDTHGITDLPELPEDEVLFAKQYYPMREVASMLGENQSLIRYWETEFEILQPKKNGKGDRFFRPADVKNLFLIFDLLRRRKFTIEGAKEYLKGNKKADERFEMIRSLAGIRQFLLELKAGL